MFRLLCVRVIGSQTKEELLQHAQTTVEQMRTEYAQWIQSTGLDGIHVAFDLTVHAYVSRRGMVWVYLEAVLTRG